MRTRVKYAPLPSLDQGASLHGDGVPLLRGNDPRVPSSRLRVIEFCGLPGAGKTTAMDRLAAHMRALNHVVYTRRDLDILFPRLRGWRKLLNVAFSGPAGWAIASRAFVMTPPRSSVTYRIRRALQLPRFFIPLHALARMESNPTVLLDDWIVNVFAGAVLDGSLRYSDARKTLKYFNQIFDVRYVFFDVEPQSAVERLCGRAEERRLRRPGVEATIFDTMDIENIRNLVESKVASLHSFRFDMIRGNMKVCSIDAGRGRTAVFDRVRSFAT